jgi:Tfp pilus assembly protein PilF
MLWTLIKNVISRSAESARGEHAFAAGIASMNNGDFAGARRYLQTALSLNADDVDIEYHLAIAEARSGNLMAAQRLLERTRLTRDSAEVNNALGNVQRLLRQLDASADSYRRALGLDGNSIAALVNLGLNLRDLGKPAEALPLLDQALSLSPDNVDALFNKAVALGDLGQSELAEQLIDRVLTIAPDFAEAHLQHAFALLKRREFDVGWNEYAWRIRIPEVDHWQDFDYPLWQGESLTGKRILIQAEQGLGDQIMFASCLPDVLARAGQTVIECDPRLAKLFARSFPSAKIFRHRIEGPPDWSSEPAFDFRSRSGDLPRMLRKKNADFPRHDGYLAADPARVAAWRKRLQSLGPGLKVGISWRGGTPHTGGRIRSLSLEDLVPLFSVSGTHFISLQYGTVAAEVAAFRARHGVVLHQWANANADMDDVAALTSVLDLTITVCTAAAHLAGGLGRPAWVMVPAVAEWRYLESGTSMPWYPSLRLLRQRRLNEWGEVLSDLNRALIEAAGSTLD